MRSRADKSRICRAQKAGWFQAVNLRSLPADLHVLAHLSLNPPWSVPPSLILSPVA